MELVFRGFEHYFAHCTDEIRASGAELILRNIPGKVR